MKRLLLLIALVGAIVTPAVASIPRNTILDARSDLLLHTPPAETLDGGQLTSWPPDRTPETHVWGSSGLTGTSRQGETELTLEAPPGWLGLGPESASGGFFNHRDPTGEFIAINPKIAEDFLINPIKNLAKGAGKKVVSVARTADALTRDRQGRQSLKAFTNNVGTAVTTSLWEAARAASDPSEGRTPAERLSRKVARDLSNTIVSSGQEFLAADEATQQQMIGGGCVEACLALAPFAKAGRVALAQEAVGLQLGTRVKLTLSMSDFTAQEVALINRKYGMANMRIAAGEEVAEIGAGVEYSYYRSQRFVRDTLYPGRPVKSTRVPTGLNVDEIVSRQYGGRQVLENQQFSSTG